MHIADLFVPGITRWNGKRAGVLARQHSGDTGLVVSIEYPPFTFDIAVPPPEAVFVEIFVDGKRHGHAESFGDGPFWVSLRAGRHEVEIRSEDLSLASEAFSLTEREVLIARFRPELRSLFNWKLRGNGLRIESIRVKGRVF